MKVLVVDDDLPTGILLQRVFSRYSVEVLTAKDGLSGIELANAQLPDLILMDQKMPNLSGVQTMEALRASPVTRHIPIVFLSACADEESQRLALVAGANGYYTKPFNPLELAAELVIFMSQMA